MAIQKQSIILFDGVCNLCNSAVQFVIKRDIKKNFSFASLQSGEGQKLLLKYGLPSDYINSFVLIENGKVYTKSSAVLKVAKKLSGLWPLLYGFIIVPEILRNNVYNWIAKNRYRWFGRRNSCMIPTAALRARFLN